MERDLLNSRSSLERGVEDDLVSRIGPMRRGRGGFRAALALTATTVVFAALAASGGVSYAVNQAKNAVNGSSASSSSEVQYGEGSCVEYVNPHGQTIPPAGQTSPGTNP